MVRTVGYQDPSRIRLIDLLKKAANGDGAEVWNNVAIELARSRKNRTEVNIDRLNKLTKNAETVVVPGKVLGDGKLDHKITIAAFKFSESALEELKEAGATIMSIQEIIEKNKSGSNIRLIK